MPKISLERREDRREAIFQAAVECLAEHGCAGTNMRTIAEAVGLTKGGLYPYFDSKEDILLAIAERYLESQVALLAPREGAGARLQLEEFLESYKESSQDPGATAARRAVVDLWLSAGDIPAVRANIQQRHETYLASLADLVRRGQEEGVFRLDVPPEHAAGLILAARDGMLFQSVKLGVPVPIPQLVDCLRRALVDYLTATPHAGDFPLAGSAAH
ncbi:MAG TPA: TetR/AcrR family transcriptional regulator [Longimicrobium sp.]|jgi:AcrR family transcriptional regulator